MKRLVSLCMLLFALTGVPGPAGAYENITLGELAEKMDSWKGKTITLRLKLKLVDYIFRKIVFYDRKNYDLEFDIAPRMKDEAFASMLLNAREGAEYLVTFEVQRLGNLGYVVGDIRGFTPVALEKLPEGGSEKR
ncbi:MAG: hypothetical protein EPN93_19610 [Spirochaetes bacterium]|nr:MAG: hypothetical protein EPN93_19610 [Spirochaetota bacterium]